MSKLYDGKLTAWFEIELDKILDAVIPPVTKLYEGVNDLEIKSRSPQYLATRQQITALAREYSFREHIGAYEKPVIVHGPVDHGDDHA